MRRVRFLAPARHEFLAEIGFYSEVGPGLSTRFRLAVEEAIARAATFPLSGSPAMGQSRLVMVSGFPFSLFYLVETEGIVIVAVAHQARKPGYWMQRLKERHP